MRGEGDCWEWTAAVSGKGYGKTSIDGKEAATHRWAYESFHGEVPPGLFVCHRCDNRRCMNPEHLFVGTAIDNFSDMVAKGRHSFEFHRNGPHGNDGYYNRKGEWICRVCRRGGKESVPRAPKVECLRGHVFDEINSYVDYRGKRVCRVCVRIRERGYYHGNEPGKARGKGGEAAEGSG